MRDKRQLFLNIWNKKNSSMKDSIKAKLKNRGVEPTELNCYEYWKKYKQEGYKKKGNRTVPNCVPK